MSGPPPWFRESPCGGLLDEAALDKILDPYSMTEPGISGKELLEG